MRAPVSRSSCQIAPAGLSDIAGFLTVFLQNALSSVSCGNEALSNLLPLHKDKISYLRRNLARDAVLSKDRLLELGHAYSDPGRPSVDCDRPAIDPRSRGARDRRFSRLPRRSLPASRR